MLHTVNIDRLKRFFRGKLIIEIERKSVVGRESYWPRQHSDDHDLCSCSAEAED